jgi:hypothetical protein
MEVFWMLGIFFGSFDLIFGEMSNSLTQIMVWYLKKWS